MIHLYGIPNCDTVKKARKWLHMRGMEYVFHDFKKEGVDQAKLRIWIDLHGYETLLNRRGSTFRNLPDEDKNKLDSGDVLALLKSYPSMIKRPIVVSGDTVLVGFKERDWDEIF